MNPADTPGSPAPVDPLIPGNLRALHATHPLAGTEADSLLLLRDDLLIYFIGALRDIPTVPPDLREEEWRSFLLRLRPHWIGPLLASHILRWPGEFQPPESIREPLRQDRLAGIARSMAAGRQCAVLLSALDEAGIPVLLMKGPALARMVYPDPSFRQSSDIDLLVAPETFGRCEEVMENLGYACTARTFRLSHQAFHHQTFTPKKHGVPVEIHWNPDYGFRYFPDTWIAEAFGRKITVRAADLTFDTLDPVDHLTCLVFHNSILHNHTRLDWTGDIARLCRQLANPADWETLLLRSVVNHVRIPLEIALSEAVLWQGALIPDPYGDFTTWPAPSERERELWPFASTQETSVRSLMRLRWQGLDGIREQVNYGYRFVFPPPHLMKEYRRSGSRLDVPVAYIRRWISIRRYL